MSLSVQQEKQLQSLYDTRKPHEAFAAHKGIEIHEIDYDGDEWNSFTQGIAFAQKHIGNKA